MSSSKESCGVCDSKLSGFGLICLNCGEDLWLNDNCERGIVPGTRSVMSEDGGFDDSKEVYRGVSLHDIKNNHQTMGRNLADDYWEYNTPPFQSDVCTVIPFDL